MKPYMQPLTRNEQTKTPGKSFVKTPGKMLPPSATKLTSTIKKQPNVNRFHSFTTPSKSSAVKFPLRQTDVPRAADMSCIDNNTFSIMNCSTSTEFDAPVANHLNPNLSVVQNATMPSFSPLMRQIEKTIDLKLTSFMETLKNQTIAQPTDITQFHETIKRAVMADVGNNEMMNSTFEVNDDEPATSTVLRKPATRKILEQTTLETTSIDTPPPRVNRRLETTDYDDAPFNFTAPKKRSNRRLTSVVNNETVCRRSTRISILREVRESKSAANRIPVEKPKPRAKRPIPSFLNRSPTRKVTKSDHKKEVLELLNTGTYKQLNLLPKIGAKTAFQILTYRTVHGKFKTIHDVQKVPAMKGKFWLNFLEVRKKRKELKKSELMKFYFRRPTC